MPERIPATSAVASLLAVAALVGAACSGGNVATNRPASALIDSITIEDWNRLAAMRILFGHQSVGHDILNGVSELTTARGRGALTIVEPPAVLEAGQQGLAHFLAGENGKPASKVSDFLNRLQAAQVKPDIAFVKFCYIDIGAATDVESLFDAYRQAMKEARRSSPQTVVVHVTAPLRLVQRGWKSVVKRPLGRPIGGYADNIARHRYNTLLRAEYGGKEPVFDLAEIESTLPDGRRIEFSSGGKTYNALAPEYTYDNGHLNETGRRIVADRMLVFLADIAKKRAGAN